LNPIEIIIKVKIKLENQPYNITSATFEMAHYYFFKSKKFENFTTSIYNILASTFKVSAQNFTF
jgi:hypothetical protein